MALPTKSLDKAQAWVLRTGVGLTVVCAVLTAMAGWHFGGGGVKSLVFAVLFAGITFGAALLLPFVSAAFSRGLYGTGVGLVMAWAVFTAGEFASHLMVFSGHRGADIQTSDLKDAAHVERDKSKADAEARLESARANLKDLLEANPWFARVSAQGLEDQIATKDEAIRQEEKRGGCGPKCLKIKEERSALADQLGKVRQKTDYEKAIETAIVDVAKARDVVISTEKGTSPAVFQANTFGSLMFATLHPGADERDWANRIIEWFIAFLLTIGPMSLVYAGLKDWNEPRKSREPFTAKLTRLWVWIARLTGKSPSGLQVVENTTVIEDGAFRRWKETLPQRLATV